jgi:hypothetical protein
MSNRDVFYNDQAARMAAFDAVVRFFPHLETTPRQLDADVDALVHGYRACEENISLADYVANSHL